MDGWLRWVDCPAEKLLGAVAVGMVGLGDKKRKTRQALRALAVF